MTTTFNKPLSNHVVEYQDESGKDFMIHNKRSGSYDIYHIEDGEWSFCGSVDTIYKNLTVKQIHQKFIGE